MEFADIFTDLQLGGAIVLLNVLNTQGIVDYDPVNATWIFSEGKITDEVLIREMQRGLGLA